MKNYFSYFRVSSTNQAENGVSLEAQQEANQKFAKEKGLEIVKEFKEIQSAAKQGRKEFNLMLSEIKKKNNIEGIIFHDVDRSARSISDWAKIKELSNKGYKIYFSRDGSDLSNRGSSLTASIKAVIAEDFIMNLSQETKKGLYKRAEQGYTVFGHTILGYKTKEKGIREIDKEIAPLILKCFELYSTGRYSLKDLAELMYKKGLRAKNGKKIEFNKLSRILNNKYYTGLIVIKNKTFNGLHKPIISIKLFNKVQNILNKRHSPKIKRYKYKFQHILNCSSCGRKLKAMTAKGKYQYYYCRNKECPMKSVLETKIEQWLLNEIKKIKFTKDEVAEMLKISKEIKNVYLRELEQRENSLKIQAEKNETKLNKLTDLFLEEKISEEEYTKKREEIINNKKFLEAELSNFKINNTDTAERTAELIKLLSDPIYAYKMANQQNRLDFIGKMIKNIKISQEGVLLEWQTAFEPLYKRKNEHLSSSFSQGVARGNRTLTTGTTNQCSSR